MNGYQGTARERASRLGWTNIPSSGRSNTPSRFLLRIPEIRICRAKNLQKGFTAFNILSYGNHSKTCAK